MADSKGPPPPRPPKRNAALANLHPGKTHVLDHQQKRRSSAQKKADNEAAAQVSAAQEKKKHQKLTKTAQRITSIEDSVLKADKEHGKPKATSLDTGLSGSENNNEGGEIQVGDEGHGDQSEPEESHCADDLEVDQGNDSEGSNPEEEDDDENSGNGETSETSEQSEIGKCGEDNRPDKSDEADDIEGDMGGAPDSSEPESEDGPGMPVDLDDEISAADNGGRMIETGSDSSFALGAESESSTGTEYGGELSASESDLEEDAAALPVPKRHGRIKKTRSRQKDRSLRDAVRERRTEDPAPTTAPKPVPRQVKRKAPESDDNSQSKKASSGSASKKVKGEPVASGLRSDWVVTNRNKISANAPSKTRKLRKSAEATRPATTASVPSIKPPPTRAMTSGLAVIKSEPVPDPSLRALFPNATVVDLTLDLSDDEEIVPNISDEDEALTNAAAEANVKAKGEKKGKHGGSRTTGSMGIVVKKENVDAAVKIENETAKKITLETHFPIPGSRAFKRFNGVYTLFALSWAGTVEHPFSVNEHDEINKKMQDMWKQVYPDHKNIRVTEHKILKSTLNSRFDTWRSEFGKRAIDALESRFNERCLDTRDARKDYVQASLQPSVSSGVPMLIFKDRENESGAFQDEVVIQVFVGAHLRRVQGAELVCNGKPIGALALAAAAVERAYTLFEKTGDDERQKAEDKARRTLFSFNDSWAATVESYMKSIKTYSDRKWARIFDEAQKVAPKAFKSVAASKTNVRGRTERGIVVESDGE
ncbi:hypothetical protein K488DRAFT_85915 [Vararia minispora EC-137]|uniref:Uncharacterized protein n=1 Tax=Vararia minispora EC-137 TaxID=1314806 RepID=A0ACB8QL38_9AGAM|nr:hypothetical protein K488DRAFT_85915 [Vararia minispora EC-137]